MLRLILCCFLIGPLSVGALLVLTQEEQEFLKAHPVMRLSVCDDAQPFEFLDNGVPRGFDIDYLKLIEQRLGVRFEFVTGLTWSEFEQAFEKHEIDILNGAPPADKYAEYGLFTDPFVYFQRVYVTQKNAPQIGSPEELKGLTVAAMKGMGYVDVWREKYPDINFLMVDSVEEVIMAVAEGNADATLVMEESFEYFKKRNALTNLRISGVDKLDAGLGNSFLYVVRKDWPELPAIFDKVMRDIPQEDMRTLWRAWFNWSDRKPRIVFSEQDWEYIESTPVVRYAILRKAPPIEFVNADGECSGLTTDYMNMLSEQTGIRVECIPVDTRAQKLEMLALGRCDLLATYATYEMPGESYLVSKPYMVFPYALATRIDVPYVNTLDACAGEKIGFVLRIGLLEPYQKRFPEVDFVGCTSLGEGLHAVSQGELFGVIGPQAVIAHQIQELYFGNLKITGRLDGQLELAAITRKKNAPLMRIMERIIGMVTPAEQQHMLNQWISIRFEQGFDYRLFWKILAGVIFIVVLIAWRFRSVAKYNRALRKLNEAQAQSIRDRDRIMSVISHDMRQPIHGYNRYLALLQDGRIDAASADGQRLLRQARQRGEQGIESMENLLTWLARATRECKQHPVSLSPHGLVEDCCELLYASIESKNITVQNRIDPEVRIQSDEQMLSTVLRNLLNNAIKFSLPDGTIEIYVGTQPSCMRLAVKDYGVGMDAQAVQAIRDGERIDSTAGATGEKGSGMGLHLCGQILKALGTQLEVESRLDQGSTFSFVLPTTSTL